MFFNCVDYNLAAIIIDNIPPRLVGKYSMTEKSYQMALKTHDIGLVFR